MLLIIKNKENNLLETYKMKFSNTKMVGVLRHLPSRAYIFEMCRKKSRAKLFWEDFGDPRGHT